ncbi:hypothetical protein G9H57_01175 [Aquirufa antheringensis]|nr:hypothetical protein [Aquirufa antheringensis]
MSCSSCRNFLHHTRAY